MEFRPINTFVFCRSCGGRIWNDTKCSLCDKEDALPDLLAACEEGEKRMKFLLDKILAAESYPEKIILELIEIDKTFNCMSLAKQAIDKAKGQRSRLSAGEN